MVLLLIPIIGKTQIINYNLPPKQYYNRANITLKNFSKYECQKLNIKSDSLSFMNIHSSANVSLALNQIDYIRVQNGNEILQWGGYGALLVGLIAILNVAKYPNSQSNPINIIAGFTISGAVLGGLIGLAIPKWKTYYLNY